jgi:hypothetical protein
VKAEREAAEGIPAVALRVFMWAGEIPALTIRGFTGAGEIPALTLRACMGMVAAAMVGLTKDLG